MWVTAYTDAGFRKDKGTWAIWLRSEKGRIIKNGDCPSEVKDSLMAELWAIGIAIATAKDSWENTEGIFVNSDCLGAIQALWPWTKGFKRPDLRKLLEGITSFAKNNGIELRCKHVKGHQKSEDTRSYLNNAVDKLTRPPNQSVSNKPKLKPKKKPESEPKKSWPCSKCLENQWSYSFADGIVTATCKCCGNENSFTVSSKQNKKHPTKKMIRRREKMMRPTPSATSYRSRELPVDRPGKLPWEP